MKRIVVCAAACAALASCHRELPPPVKPVPAAKPKTAEKPVARVTTIDMTTFFSLREADKVLVYDVRPVWMYNVSHIAGAQSWSGSALVEQFAQRDAEMKAARAAGKTVVLYCTNAKCQDSRAVAKWLASQGHATAVLDGGIEAWKEAGLPVE